MKHHLIVKMRRPLADGRPIPNWVDFIRDKSVVREHVTPEVDRLFSALALRVWVTHEYQPAHADWSLDEQREGLDRTYRLILQHDYQFPRDLVARISLVPDVEHVHHLAVGEAELPNPARASTMSLAARRPADMIGLGYARALTRGTPAVKIAVLDTGMNMSHRELTGKVAKAADFVDLAGLDTSDFVGDITGYDDVPEDEVGHGTHVSGIIAARGLEMDEGVAPECSLFAVRVLATMKNEGRLYGAGVVDNINPAIKAAVDWGADVLNMSLGIRHLGGGLPHADVIRYALARNVTVVAASGNDGTSERYYPGALPGVFAVGAVDAAGQPANFTSYGANIAVGAPGVNIYSAYARNGYAVATGTSQASPFVAGMVGLMKSYAAQFGSTLSNVDIRDVLRHTSDKVDRRLRHEHAGYGLINMVDAFKFLTYQLA
jgi:thermitase